MAYLMMNLFFPFLSNIKSQLQLVLTATDVTCDNLFLLCKNLLPVVPNAHHMCLCLLQRSLGDCYRAFLLMQLSFVYKKLAPANVQCASSLLSTVDGLQYCVSIPFFSLAYIMYFNYDSKCFALLCILEGGQSFVRETFKILWRVILKIMSGQIVI